MPDKPTWYGRIESAIRTLEAVPVSFVGRNEIEASLHVGRRRAQQILKPLVKTSVGKSFLADRSEVVAHLRHLSTGSDVQIEEDRRARVAKVVAPNTGPRVLVEAPTKIVNQRIEDLPKGVVLAPGRIVIEGFTSPEEAKRLMLALIMGMGNDPDGFDAGVSLQKER